MGWDLKATADAVGQALPEVPKLPEGAGLPPWLGDVAVVFAVLAFSYWLFKPMLSRAWKVMEETIFSNWRLALLAATALVLSLASGWTTWDGMKNFTNEPVLSFMITFGIQGVMLIIAWIIGESFATGMSQRPAASGAPRVLVAHRDIGPFIGAMLGLAIAAIALVAILHWSGWISARRLARLAPSDMAIFATGLLIVATVVFLQRSDLLAPYTASARIIVKNMALWVMFLACMATSVFFSFDSLFTAIFPQEERVRAAELRAQNQVAGIVADIGQTISSRRITAAEDLFQNDGWKAYDTQLDSLAKASRGAEGEIEAYYVQKMEERRRGIAEQHERIATAQSGQAGLSVKKANLTEELSRLEAERPALATELAQKKTELEGRAKEVDAKRVEAMAEDKGVEGTLKVGKGPIWRERMAELGKLQDYYKIGEERVKDAQKRLDAVNSRIDQTKRELAEIDGSLAKLQGEAQTAEQRIANAQAGAGEADDAAPKVDPSRVLPAFEALRVEFRQQPDEEHLVKLQQQCTQLLNAMTSTPNTKERVKGIDCDPKQASEAAAVLFALNAGVRAFETRCAGGDKLAANTSADALFGFARSCLADSGLPSKETDKLRTKINVTELNRDDKAHRFVVTWNAFGDGNRLAYLALGIAVAIDLLVFMSGLFGANAVRSPLSDVPTPKARSARQLESIIENALLPDTFENARLTLHAMRPITNASGFMAEVSLDRLDPHTAERVLAVLNAGATINAVEHDEARERYLVRAELFEFLSVVAKKAFEASEHHVNLAELEKIIAVALLPDVRMNAETVLHYMHPIEPNSTLLERLGLKGPHGFTAEIELDKVEPLHRRAVLGTLNAGATLDAVQRAGGASQHYFIHKDLYKTIARIRARSLFSGGGEPRLAAPDASAQDGGALVAGMAAIEDKSSKPHRPPPIPPMQSRLEDEFRAALLKSMGLDETAYALVARPDFVGSAIAAGKSLEQLKETNSLLSNNLRRRERDMRDALHHTYQTLWSRQGDDERRIAALNGVNDEIESLIPALMLSPRGPYEQVLSQLIVELEHAAGPDEGLDDDQQNLLDRLRGHAAALALVNRDSAEAWQRVGQLVFAWDEGYAEDRRTPNA